MNFSALLILAFVLVATSFAQVRSTAYKLDLAGLAYVNYKVAFIKTSDGKIWRSADEGLTWVDQTSVLGHTDHKIRFLALNPSNDTRVWFLGDGVAWRSADSGATYEFLSSVPKFFQVNWHPSVPDWGLGVAFSEGCKQNSGCSRVLWLTQDWGATWKPILDYVSSFTWAQPGEGDDTEQRSKQRDDGTTPDFEVTKQAILAVVARDKNGNQAQKAHDQFDLVYSSNFFSTDPEVVLEHCYWLEQGDSFWLAYATGDDLQTQLWVSVQPYYSSFKKALFPPNTKLRENHFNVLQEFSDSIWLAVDPWNTPDSVRDSWTDVYQSGSNGARYVRVLRHVSKHGRGIEFDQIGALEGFYLANIVDGLPDDNDNQNQDGPLKDKKIKTLITFDNGGGKATWRTLIPPQKDSLKQPTNCLAPNCSLHLHGTWDSNGRWGPFYAPDNAIGLVIATGNIGPYLDFDTVNTYYSRDGGLSWEEIMKGPSIYEFGDHGAITVLAPTNVKTNTIMYSLDEGLNWYTYTIPLDPIFVENIIIEPSNTGERFILYGINNGKRNWVGLDFSGTLGRNCLDTDYEQWQPSEGDLQDQRCMLGHTITYRRRKRDAYCYNQETEDSVVTVTNCVCTDEDYECDYGYEQDDSGACVLLNPPPSDLMMQPSYCPVGATYNSSDGYRKVPGDTCVDGVTHVGPPKKCVGVDSTDHKKPASLGLIIGFGFLLPASLLAAFITIRYSSSVRSKLTCVKWPASWDHDDKPVRSYKPLQQQGVHLDEVVEDDPDELHDDTHEHHDDLNLRALASDDTHIARPTVSSALASIFGGEPDGKIIINLPASTIENTSASTKREEPVDIVSHTTTTTAISESDSATSTVATTTAGEPATLPNESLLDSTA